MKNDLRLDIRRKARLFRGMVNVLKDDAMCICIDAETCDLFNIIDSLCEAKETLNKMSVELDSLEQMVRDLKQEESRRLRTRNKHTSL